INATPNNPSVLTTRQLRPATRRATRNGPLHARVVRPRGLQIAVAGQVGVARALERHVARRACIRPHLQPVLNRRMHRMHQVSTTTGAGVLADGDAIVAAAVAPSDEPAVAAKNSGP